MTKPKIAWRPSGSLAYHGRRYEVWRRLYEATWYVWDRFEECRIGDYGTKAAMIERARQEEGCGL